MPALEFMNDNPDPLHQKYLLPHDIVDRCAFPVFIYNGKKYIQSSLIRYYVFITGNGTYYHYSECTDEDIEWYINYIESITGKKLHVEYMEMTDEQAMMISEEKTETKTR